MILVKYDDFAPIVGGLDLSSTTDLTAWSMLQRKPDQGYRANWRFYIPEERAKQAEKADRVPYRLWAQQGYITLTRGNRIDYATIKRDILRDVEDYRISQIGFDPWNADYLTQELDASGVDLVSVRQGFASLSGPCKQFEASISEGTFEHGANPIAEWQAGNVEVETDANGNIRPVKPKHGASGKRIDGIVSALIAIAVLLVAEAPAEFDYYDQHELEIM